MLARHPERWRGIPSGGAATCTMGGDLEGQCDSLSGGAATWSSGVDGNGGGERMRADGGVRERGERERGRSRGLPTQPVGVGAFNSKK
nr:unnamed protein product [Digitaria exilis]